MKNYCLNVEEVFDILKWQEDEKPIACKELALEIAESSCWTTRIICFTIFIARILEKDKISEKDLKRRIATLYSVGDEFWFEMQEMNDHFVEYLLLQYLRNKDDSLEDFLIEIQNGLSEYNYEKAIRY